MCIVLHCVVLGTGTCTESVPLAGPIVLSMGLQGDMYVVCACYVRATW